MTPCLIALGSNIGDRQAVLDGAAEALASLDGVRLVSVSSWRATPPVGGPEGQGGFLNGAARLETSMAPAEFLTQMHRVESQAGRERRERWAARTLDLDLLLWGDTAIDAPGFTVPHPRMSFRPFVLGPACEIAPEMRHPLLGATLGELQARLATGEDKVRLAGGGEAMREILAQAIADRPGVRIDDAATRPKLQVLAGGAEPLAGVPSLWLASREPAAARVEIQAAVECVWPSGG